MLKEAIDRILLLAEPHEVLDGDLHFTDKELFPVQAPLSAPIAVHTLTGVVELILAGVEDIDNGGCVVVVQTYRAVSLCAKTSDVWGRRQTYVTAAPDEIAGFRFGTPLSAEEFAIALQAQFVPGVGDVEYLARLASSITAEGATLAEDDGVSQKVTVRSGIALKDQVQVKRRVSLAPYRTFREVEQPASDFVFRVMTDAQGVKCALFEADGGAWRLAAMASVKAWLAERITDIEVVA